MEPSSVDIGLTEEDEFVLTCIRAKAYELEGKKRNQYLWQKIFRMVCRERAYKTVMEAEGICLDINMSLFEDCETPTPIEEE